jgi:hypothetical protein
MAIRMQPQYWHSLDLDLVIYLQKAKGTNTEMAIPKERAKMMQTVKNMDRRITTKKPNIDLERYDAIFPIVKGLYHCSFLNSSLMSS